MDGQTSAAGPASSCDALGPRLNSPGPNLETKPGSAICAGSTCIRVLADLSVYCLRKSMHSNLQCATFLQVSSTLIRQQPSDQTHVFFLNHFLRWSSYFWLLQPQLPCVSQGSPGRQLSIYIYLYLSISIYIYLYLSISIYIYLYLSISIYLSVYLSLSPVYLTVYLAIDPSTYQSIYPSIYLSLYRTPQIGGSAAPGR